MQKCQKMAKSVDLSCLIIHIYFRATVFGKQPAVDYEIAT